MNILKLQDIKLIHRNPLHSYILTMRKETIPFTIVTIIKHLGINLPKETKDLYREKYKKKTDERNQR